MCIVTLWICCLQFENSSVEHGHIVALVNTSLRISRQITASLWKWIVSVQIRNLNHWSGTGQFIINPQAECFGHFGVRIPLLNSLPFGVTNGGEIGREKHCLDWWICTYQPNSTQLNPTPESPRHEFPWCKCMQMLSHSMAGNDTSMTQIVITHDLLQRIWRIVDICWYSCIWPWNWHHFQPQTVKFSVSICNTRMEEVSPWQISYWLCSPAYIIADGLTRPYILSQGERSHISWAVWHMHI